MGNLRQKTLGSRTVDVSYNNYYNRPISNTDTAGSTRIISHDTRGNVTRLGDLTFGYDYTNQPVQISGSSNGSYKYDGNLKRVKSVVDGKIIYNVYNAAGKLVHVDAVTDGKQTEYIHGAGQTLARITNDTDITYLHNDHLGTPIMGTDAAGNELWEEEYTPFGEKYESNAANDDLGGYTGHVYDSATGLNYMQARYHDPVIGRFLSIDPVGFSEAKPYSFNRYSHVGNNPYGRTDPNGMDDADTLPLTDDDSVEHVLVTGSSSNDLEFQQQQQIEDAYTTIDFFIDGGFILLDVINGPLPETAAPLIVARHAAKKAAREKSKKAAAQKASEKFAKNLARRIGKSLGNKARRDFHDKKTPGGGDRTKEQLIEDAKEVFMDAGEDIPDWLK